jgi:hypothetical protein
LRRLTTNRTGTEPIPEAVLPGSAFIVG